MFMTDEKPPSACGSFFAPQGRATPAEVSGMATLCQDDPLVQAALEAVDSFAVVLNAQRQILAANSTLLQALTGEETSALSGLRPGEAFGCIHSGEGPDGCGSSRACRRCGALNSILATQETRRSASAECLLSTRRHGSWEAKEFWVRTTPVTVAGHPLTLLTLRDISAQKRREALERVFIHDLQDSLQSFRGWSVMLQAAGADATAIAEQILALTSHLTAQVESQARLLWAESGELLPHLRTVSPEYILDELFQSLGADQAARLIRVPTAPEPPLICTDPEILGRILSQMALNALEALPLGGQAQIWHERRSGRQAFLVQNPGCIPLEVADRVFQRSFSTKPGLGRGLGTYGMKLLGETVLGGRVGFTTNWEEGTRFFVELPGEE
jgi:signal transduction histidine kinase